jgi:hypothetical protein
LPFKHETFILALDRGQFLEMAFIRPKVTAIQADWHDFSQVRIHTSGPAAQAAQALGVPAFTFGRDIAFTPGAYNPGSAQGQHILAHELAHVVQQSEGAGIHRLSTQDGSHQRLEQDAEQRPLSPRQGRSDMEEPSTPEPASRPSLAAYTVPAAWRAATWWTG